MNKQPIPPIPQKNYFKVWFGNHQEVTAGLILNKQQHGTMTIGEISRMFPMSEIPKMKRFYRSKFFRTYEEAFNATSDDVEFNAWINR